MRRVRHVYADDDEYIAVHRKPKSFSYTTACPTSSVGTKIRRAIMIAALAGIGFALGGAIFGFLFLIAVGVAALSPSGGCASHAATFGWMLLLFIPGWMNHGFVLSIVGGIAIAVIAAFTVEDI